MGTELPKTVSAWPSGLTPNFTSFRFNSTNFPVKDMFEETLPPDRFCSWLFTHFWPYVNGMSRRSESWRFCAVNAI
jgi:hypothetical protein